jgi:hypothetical protein
MTCWRRERNWVRTLSARASVGQGGQAYNVPNRTRQVCQDPRSAPRNAAKAYVERPEAAIPARHTLLSQIKAQPVFSIRQAFTRALRPSKPDDGGPRCSASLGFQTFANGAASPNRAVLRLVFEDTALLVAAGTRDYSLPRNALSRTAGTIAPVPRRFCMQSLRAIDTLFHIPQACLYCNTGQSVFDV